MAESLNDLPETERAVLLSHYFDRWKGQVSPDEPDQAKAFCKDIFIYSIRMFWIGRSDKINRDSIRLFDWLSRHILDEAAGYSGIKPGETLINKFVVDAEAKQMFESLWALYEKHPENGFNLADPPSLLDRVSSFFRR